MLLVTGVDGERSLLEAGTVSVVCSIENPDACGPNGWKGSIIFDDSSSVDLPSAV